ncbi:uncharacterized protein LOC115995944 [Ipomoea triloba]|uniref:uncharacterized protein LOC115995944 n=1 Tax=Ipomoea triloba TaxID=35885 RepID=UPI00125E722E|nr:uncharacterized protein LOC115995944 [Ipomoea triloba]
MEVEAVPPPVTGGGSAEGFDGGARTVKRFKHLKQSFMEVSADGPSFEMEVPVRQEEMNWFEEDILVADKEDESSEIDDGIRVVRFSKKVREDLIKPWKNALLVKYLGKPVAFSLFQQRMLRLWNPAGKTEFIDVGSGWFILRFQLQSDCMHVLVDGPWKLFDQYVVAQRWKPKFDASMAKVERMAVWVRVLGLPIEYFREDAIKEILATVGTPLKLDMTTAGIQRGKFARGAVEIDLTKPLVGVVMVDDLPRKVEFEGLHTICFDCGEVGHRSGSCPKNRSEAKMARGTSQEEGLAENMHVEEQRTPTPMRNMVHG